MVYIDNKGVAHADFFMDECDKTIRPIKYPKVHFTVPTSPPSIWQERHSGPGWYHLALKKNEDDHYTYAIGHVYYMLKDKCTNGTVNTGFQRVAVYEYHPIITTMHGPVQDYTCSQVFGFTTLDKPNLMCSKYQDVKWCKIEIPELPR